MTFISLSMRFLLPQRRENKMLTLSRKKGESLVINNNIEVTILDIRGDQIKVGIAAPKEVPVYRKEIFLEIQESNKNAMESGDMEALKNLF